MTRALWFGSGISPCLGIIEVGSLARYTYALPACIKPGQEQARKYIETGGFPLLICENVLFVGLVFLNGSGGFRARTAERSALRGRRGFEMCVTPFGGRAHGSLRGAAIGVYLWLGVAPGGMREGISPLASAGLRRRATHTPKELITQERRG